MAVALALTGCAASSAPPPQRELKVLKHQVHSQCPLAVNHPSVLIVRSRDEWGRMLAAARSLPPPYSAAATDFGQQAVVVVALASTPAPTTEVAVPSERAVMYVTASKRINVTLQVTEPQLPPGTMLPAVVGMPCVVAWIPAVDDAGSVVARTTDGKLIAERTM